jgi:hypothetical protein
VVVVAAEPEAQKIAHFGGGSSGSTTAAGFRVAAVGLGGGGLGSDGKSCHRRRRQSKIMAVR